jgi:N-acetylneuraminic acid mutarotase
VAVSEVGVAVLGDELHVVGGYVAGRPHSRTHLVLDLSTGVWHRAAPLPVALDHVGVAALHGELWAVGGYGTTGASARVLRWNPTSDGWSDGPPLPSPRAAGLCVVLDGRIHYVGGKRGAAELHDHLVLDGGRWRLAAPMPTARDHAAGAVVGGRLYVAAGRPHDLTRLEVYDPLTDRWSRLPDVPLGRSSVAGAAYRGQLLVLGGEHPVEQGVDREVDAYDPRTRRWSRLPDLPLGLQGTQAVVVHGVLYLPGGGPVGGGGVQSDRLLELR